MRANIGGGGCFSLNVSTRFFFFFFFYDNTSSSFMFLLVCVCALAVGHIFTRRNIIIISWWVVGG